MDQRRYYVNQEKNISVYDLENDNLGRNYLFRLFQNILNISKGVIVWLWMPSADSKIVIDKSEALKNQLNRFKQVGIDKYYNNVPIQLMYSYWKSKDISQDKYNLLLDLLVDSWMGYDHPELFFIGSSLDSSIKEDIIMDRKGRSINDLNQLYPYICCYKEPDRDVLRIDNESLFSNKDVLIDIT